MFHVCAKTLVSNLKGVTGVWLKVFEDSLVRRPFGPEEEQFGILMKFLSICGTHIVLTMKALGTSETVVIL